MGKYDNKLMYTDTLFLKDAGTSELLNMIKSLERYRMFLYKTIDTKLQKTNIPNLSYYYRNKMEKELHTLWDIENSNGRIKIYIPEIPPSIYIKTSSEALGYFSELWKEKTSYSIRSLSNYPFKFEKIFVWIKCFNPISFDADNKYIKPFIDGIVRSNIIQDDNYRIVKYGCEGILDKKNPHTEVYIFGDNNIPDFINKGIN